VPANALLQLAVETHDACAPPLPVLSELLQPEDYFLLNKSVYAFQIFWSVELCLMLYY